LVGSLLQNPLVLSLVAVVLLVFATSLLGFWEIRLPSALTQAASKSYSGYFGSLFMGLTLGVIAAPCIGPFILGLLTWVASMGDPLLGFLVFFTLSLGLGLPLLILALFSGRLDKLPRSGDWMLWVRKLLGWILVGMAAYFIRPVLPKAIGLFVFASVLLAAGVHLGWIQTAGSQSRLFKWLKTLAGVASMVAATILIGGWAMQGPEANWHPYSRQLLMESKTAGKPVVIDFSAAWCAPCRELDEITFRDPDVVTMSKEKIVMIKVDLTRKGDALNDRLVQEYNVKGVPTVLFIDRNGEERPDLRLLDFIPPDQFLIRLAELIKIGL
jgi:thiol:disulfide interchange protein DsbD